MPVRALATGGKNGHKSACDPPVFGGFGVFQRHLFEHFLLADAG
jgi:hypothetical protein